MHPCLTRHTQGRGGAQFTMASHYTPFLLRLWIVYRMVRIATPIV